MTHRSQGSRTPDYQLLRINESAIYAARVFVTAHLAKISGTFSIETGELKK